MSINNERLNAREVVNGRFATSNTENQLLNILEILISAEILFIIGLLTTSGTEIVLTKLQQETNGKSIETKTTARPSTLFSFQ
jgi:hypothetical protein